MILEGGFVTHRRRFFIRGCAALVAIGLSWSAHGDPYGGPWSFTVKPALWFPAVSATLKAPSGAGGSIEIEPDDWFSDWKFGVILGGEARLDRWLVFTDFIYADFGTQEADATPIYRTTPTLIGSASTDMDAILWTLGGGYRIVEGPALNLDLIGGVRYAQINNQLTLDLYDNGRLIGAQQRSSDESSWNVLIGAKGEVRFQGTPWFVPFYGDIGTGDANLTWQAALGVGYAFDWGQASLAWRAVGYELDGGDDFTFAGPTLGVGLAF
jgi:hypothetical protein